MRVVLLLVVELLLVLVLLGYFTLLERKVLGYGQLRKGPNKAVLWGIIQPLADGLKLFMKGFWGNTVSGFLGLWLFPSVSLVVVLGLWVCMLEVVGVYGGGFIMLYVILLGGFVGAGVFVSGYLTGGKYSMLGSVRSLAQIVSYEGVLVLSLMSLFVFSASAGELLGVLVALSSVVLVFLVVAVVMESNRTPVDFVEGESELVSGLATEMGGLSFSLLFLVEYGLMGFYSFMVALVGLGGSVSIGGIVVVALGFMLFLTVLRLSLPRSRYDLSMEWGWKVALVSVFLWFVMVYGLVV